MDASPAEEQFNNEHRKGDQQDGSAHHSKRDPRKSVASARLAGIFSIVSDQQKSKVGEVVCLTAKKILVGRVCAFQVNSGEALVFTSPFVFALVKIAQANPLALLCVVGKGQTDGQWRVQLSDGIALAVQKGDVEDRAGQSLLVSRVANGAADVRSNQSGVGLVIQVRRDKEGSHYHLFRGAGEDHQLAGGKIGGDDNHIQGRIDRRTRSSR